MNLNRSIKLMLLHKISQAGCVKLHLQPQPRRRRTTLEVYRSNAWGYIKSRASELTSRYDDEGAIANEMRVVEDFDLLVPAPMALTVTLL